MKALAHLGKIAYSTRLIAVCMLCFLAVGCGTATASVPKTTTTPAATATVGATVTPSPTSVATTLYTSPDGGYSLYYPTGWLRQTLTNANTTGAIGFAAPDSADLFFIFPLTTQVASSAYPAVAQSFLEQGVSATNVQLSNSTGTITLPSGTWTTLDGNGMLNTTTYDCSQLALDHGNGTFFLYILAADSSANAAIATYFEPMLLSFRFLK